MPSSISYPAALLIAGLIYSSSAVADDLSILKVGILGSAARQISWMGYNPVRSFWLKTMRC